MRRVHKKLLAFASLVIVATIGVVAANLLIQKNTMAARGTVTEYHRTTSRNPDVHVGYFEIDNEQAYCIEHDKWSVLEGTTVNTLSGFPMTITDSSPEAYKRLFKILYYGTKNDFGRIPMSIASSYVYTSMVRSGATSPASLTDDDYAEQSKPQSVNAQALYDYALSQPLPNGIRTLTLWTSGDNRYQTLAQFGFEAYQSLTLTKIWVDKNNAYNTRPASVSFNVYLNGSYYSSYTLSGTGNTWTLPISIPDGTVDVTETTPTGYIQRKINNTTIKNYYPSVARSTVTKVWNDFNNVPGTRPSSINVDLYQNGNYMKTVTLSGTGNTWTFTQDEISEYDENGNMYNYTWAENSVPSGYTKSQSGNTITNTLINTTSSTVTKVWNDWSNKFSTRPGSINVDLLRNGSVYKTVALTGSGNTWTHTESNLEKYDASGHAYSYTWRESATPSGYNMSQSGNTITNSAFNETTSTVTKIWVDWDNRNSTRPASVSIDLLQNGTKIKTVSVTGTGSTWTHTETGLAKYDTAGNAYTYTWRENVPTDYTMTQTGNTITNTHKNVTSSTVTKIWKDNSNAYSTRPSSISLDLYRNGSKLKTVTVNGTGNSWTYTENNLERYDDDGHDYTYTWKEPNTPTNYVASQSGNTITNLLTGKTSLTFYKKWVDNSNKYGTRPENATFNILRNGAKVDEVTFTGAGNQWGHTISNLDKYDSEGKEYVYTVEESNVPENYAITSNVNNIITNKLAAYRALGGIKTWKDNSNGYNLRPSNITLNLYKTLDGETSKTKVEGVTPNWTKNGNEWTYTFENLPVYEDGVLINYSVTEDIPTNYKNNISGYNITNTLYGKIAVSGTKTWIYNGAPDRARPTEITVVLLRNGERYKTATVKAVEEEEPVDDVDDGDDVDDVDGDEEEEEEEEEEEAPATAVWYFEFTDLDKYDSEGVLYEYTIEEIDVENYDTLIEQYDITNEYDPDLITIHVDKVWLNDNEDDRPGKIDVVLLRDGKVYDEVELNNETGWEYEWEDMDPNYDYTVEESYQIPGYYPGVTVGDVENGFTIENRKIPKNPKTLDNIGAAGVILGASIAAGAVIISRKRR